MTGVQTCALPILERCGQADGHTVKQFFSKQPGNTLSCQASHTHTARGPALLRADTFGLCMAFCFSKVKKALLHYTVWNMPKTGEVCVKIANVYLLF